MLAPERAERLVALVEAALALSGPVERAALLELECGRDTALRTEVESLLRFESPARELINAPAIHIHAETFLADHEDPGVGERATFQPGDTLGDYRIVSLLGDGGMGEVYLADDLGLERQVAIKLIKRGMATAALLRNFRQEKLILAALNHPHIARLYGGAVSADGLPYLVMEYVEGERLDEFCNAHALGLPERLQLFRKVCAAVSYAHQHLVIHRDLKPANIRVTPEGEPKLLDFGIAKLLEPHSAPANGAETLTQFWAMTPEYASPEQVRGEAITTASDVYSLGVILYELLTGQRPYRLTTRQPLEMARQITERLPAPPSAAARGGVQNPQALRGDMDVIALKALRKEPERRYASVAQFSDDLRRHLAGLPVTASPDTFAYRTAKFVARNRLAVAAAALVLLVILAGFVTALWEAEAARRQRDLAQHERVKAERINGFLQRMLSFSNQSVTSVSPVVQRRNVTVNEMLDGIAAQALTELADAPDVRAQVLHAIGSAYASQGRYAEAETHLRAALATQRELAGDASAEVAAIRSELGVLAMRQLKLEEANQLLEKAVADLRQGRAAGAPDFSAAKLALALNHLGVVTFYRGDRSRAAQLCTEALSIAAAAHLQGRERRILAAIQTDLGGIFVMQGETEKGEPLLRASLAGYQEIAGPPPWEQGATLLMLGMVALSKNQLDDAQKYLLESERIYRDALGDENNYLAVNLERQAAVCALKNDLPAAEEKARAALAMAQRVTHNKTLLGTGALETLGDILVKADNVEEGAESWRQALAIFEEQPTKNYFSIVPAKIRLSQILLAQNHGSEAGQMALAARDEAVEHLGADAKFSVAAAENLRAIREKLGQRDPAERLK